ncbi:hypothetical protein [Aestuariispira insulae]|uniref:N-acetyltransferase domain-containing protein n=1 Tax=Aestuariispira insulae TaxID=1461337 RepID=A0A3D9HW16_9PROT|nr:hypothetical protein [Aestuariispira insulae]RED53703.1 hypothetical protein DFP90_101497 [Aestuariispira insulae]
MTIAVKDYSVELVSDAQAFQMVLAVRCQAFHDEDLEEEIDGNDYCSTHFLIRDVNRKPVAALRWRDLGNSCAIWERWAITPRARGDIKLFRLLAEVAEEYSKFKGIRRAYGSATNPKKIKYWKAFGARETGNVVTYGGKSYFEMVKDLPLSNTGPSEDEIHRIEASRFFNWTKSESWQECKAV